MKLYGISACLIIKLNRAKALMKESAHLQFVMQVHISFVRSYFIKKAANLDKGANAPGSEIVGVVTRKQLEEIAEAKMIDLNANDIDAAVNILAGSARSMGIQVQG